jgi:tRNA(Ile)-lysidine synthase
VSEAATGALDLLEPYASLLLAVSGGPDSAALMLLVARWRGRDSRAVAVATVDHGLRPESRGEAEQVGAWARNFGFAHHLLSWDGPKPATRLQERARAARYALLADCAHGIGAQAVVTAHHADDQAETILFRLTRGSGVAGLAGMAPTGRLGDLALLRPLLGLPKSELIGICEAAGQPHVRDPSNADDAYARVRLRKLAPMLAELGLDRGALLRLGARAGRADAALAEAAEALRARARLDAGPEGADFDPFVLRDAPLELLQRLLAAEIGRLAPAAPLRLDRLERAAERLAEALAGGGTCRLTLAGWAIEAGPRRLALRRAPPRRAKAEPDPASS